MITDKAVCIVCGSEQTLRYPPRFVEGRLWSCRDCGLRFLYPQPSAEDLSRIYDKSYYRSANSNHRGYTDYEGDRENIQRSFQRRLERLQRICPDGGRLLDVGCAYGYFLDEAARAGWDVRGIDISHHAVEVASKTHGDRVQQGSFLEVDLPASQFELVTMWDYLEHSLDPKADLVKAHSLLVEGGILTLTTSDATSWPAKIMRHRWMGFKLEEHLCFFSRETMRRLLADVGFRMIAVGYDGKFVTLNLLLQRLGFYVPPVTPIVGFLQKRKLVPSVSIYTNPFDIIMVVAQKCEAKADLTS